MRTFLATILGLVVSIAATKGLEILGHSLFPIELEIDPTNIEEVKQIMFKIPAFMLVIVIIAHLSGLILGLIVSRAIERNTRLPLYYISGLMLLLALINILLIQHPLWFIIIDLSSIVLISIFYIIVKGKTNATRN